MTQPRTTSPLARFVVLIVLAWGIAISMAAWFISNAGLWNVLANTRLLDVLVEIGVVRYHDAQMGIVDGVPNHEFFIMSQDPVDYRLVVFGFALYILYWLVESWRFRESLRFATGADPAPRVAERAFLTGSHYGRWIPFRFRDAAVETCLEKDGVATDDTRRAFAVYETSTFLFQIVLFLLIGFIASGFGRSVVQILPGLGIFLVTALVARKSGLLPARPVRELLVTARHILRSPQAWGRVGSLAALGMLLDDVAPYILAQAFTDTHVILNVPFITIQGAVAAGYIAARVRLTPKGIGQYELAFTLSLSAAGVGLPEAATIALLDSGVRHIVGLVFGIVARRRSGVRFGEILARYLAPAAPAVEGVTHVEAAGAIPLGGTPRLPDLGRLATGLVWLGWAVLGLFFLDRIAFMLMDYWLLDDLGYASVFWTNFEMGALLFGIGLVASLLPLYPVLRASFDNRLRRVLIHLELMLSLLDAYAFSGAYFDILMSSGASFGHVDPVFGNDVSFYAFTLPSVWAIWWFALRIAISTLGSWLLVSWLSRGEPAARADGSKPNVVVAFFAHLSTLGTRISLVGLLVTLAVGAWLIRYDVLFADNTASSIFTGASYVDAEGLFSTVNSYAVLAVMLLVVAVVGFLGLGHLRRAVLTAAPPPARTRSWLVRAGILALVLMLAFPLLVRLRQMLFVTPNEPVIQLPYIQAHIDATRLAYGFDAIETREYRPARVGDPVPSVDRLLASTMVQNVPLWPGFASYLENLIDPQHTKRLAQTGGDTLVYGPLIEVFRQQEQLRPYYEFLDIDTVRYPVDGQTRMLVSSVREVPLIEPKPWLAWWGQRFMLYTHGLGLVAALVSEATPEGLPRYVAAGLPTTTRVPGLAQDQQRVYYGEGAGSIAYTNVKHMKELDFSNLERREEIWFPEDVKAGVHIDSIVKRLVLGYASGQFWQILFSDLITSETRAHYFRTPLERARRIAPFLYYDTDPFAFVADGRVQWMVNGISWTRNFPMSMRDDLGDKSDSRSRELHPHEVVSYARDSVKVVIDGMTGQTTFYKVRSEPVVDTLARIYPDLFRPIEEMPAAARAQLQYPVQLYHLLFDNLYILYQMKDPMTFFNMEDMWDDADEVLGPILDEGHAIRFSMEPFNVMLDADEAPFPRASTPTQFALAMAFTPEGGAHNLRSIPVVYQDGADYGRMVVLQIPKGHFAYGPEQADTIIDQDPDIAQEFTWWTRRGVEVIRGHTSMLVVGDEVLYVEPVFLRSRQNPMPMMKRVIVVFRGTAFSAETFDQALRGAIDRHSRSPRAP